MADGNTAGDTLLAGYALMLRSRFFEDETERLFDAGELYGTTHLATGQEAAQAGLCLALDPDDWIVSTHRCHGYAVCKGTEPYRLFSELYGGRDGVCKGLAGSMHFQDFSRRNAGSSAIVGSGIPLATGIAFSLAWRRLPQIGVAVFGDGACSRGTLHECMNLASIWNLPELFYCENNLYGMSAPSERMISASPLSSRAAGYGIASRTVDGNDLEAVLQAAAEARAYILSSRRPFFLEVLTYRQKGHSKNDKRLYRTREEERRWLDRDPILLAEQKILSRGLATADDLRREKEAIRAEILSASQEARRNRADALSPQEARALVYAPEAPLPEPASPEPRLEELSYREGIRRALDALMDADPSVVLMGEDIGLYGGCFKVTGDLFQRHGAQVLETPVCEESFTGLAVGAAKTGLRPVVEVMYADFATLVSDPIINHAAKSWFMSGGAVSCPVTVRLPEGSGTGHGPQHTQCSEAMFLNTPGLVVLAPSTPRDAYQMLIQAVRSPNPVLFFEHKALYGDRQRFDLNERPLPMGKARIMKEGSSVTLVGCSMGAAICLKAAGILQSEGVDAEVVDLRCLKPLDAETVLASVRKTGLAVLVGCSPVASSVLAEVESVVCSDERAFAALRAPVVRLGAWETPTPFNKALEAAYVPSPEEVAAAARALLSRRRQPASR